MDFPRLLGLCVFIVLSWIWILMFRKGKRRMLRDYLHVLGLFMLMSMTIVLVLPSADQWYFSDGQMMVKSPQKRIRTRARGRLQPLAKQYAKVPLFGGLAQMIADDIEESIDEWEELISEEPGRTIRVDWPFPPGAIVDIVSRLDPAQWASIIDNLDVFGREREKLKRVLSASEFEEARAEWKRVDERVRSEAASEWDAAFPWQRRAVADDLTRRALDVVKTRRDQSDVTTKFLN